MAVTVASYLQNFGVQQVDATITADGNIDFASLGPIYAMCFQAKGTFGSGTLKLQVSNNGTDYVDAPTAASVTSDGVKSAATADCGYKFYRLNLASSTNPNIVVKVRATLLR